MASSGLCFISMSFCDPLCWYLCKMGKLLLLYTLCFFSMYFFFNHALHKDRRGFCRPL